MTHVPSLTRKHDEPVSNERGIAVIIAVLVVVALSMMGLYLCTTVATNRHQAGDKLSRSKALHIAEAGVYEALQRIQDGLGPDPNAANAERQVVQVLLEAAPGLAGVDTTLLATGQPAGQWLKYSTVQRGPNALTIEFLTDAARTMIMRYDQSKNPPIQAASGSPIYRVTSIGKVGDVSRRLVVQAVMTGSVNLRGAVVSGVDIKYTGSGVDCGYNHRADTPIDKGIDGRSVPDGCNEDPGLNHWETGAGNTVGTLSYGTFEKTGPSEDYGVPPVVENATGFYDGPWEVFGMSEADFLAWVGPQVAAPAVPNGIYYVDNDGIPGNQSCNVAYPGAVTGGGLLYVDGDLTMNNDFEFKGLIYCEGTLKCTNKAWVLGSIIARGRAGQRNDMTGPNTFLFSTAAVEAIAGAPGAGTHVRTISWLEQP